MRVWIQLGNFQGTLCEIELDRKLEEPASTKAPLACTESDGLAAGDDYARGKQATAFQLGRRKIQVDQIHAVFRQPTQQRRKALGRCNRPPGRPVEGRRALLEQEVQGRKH